MGKFKALMLAVAFLGLASCSPSVYPTEWTDEIDLTMLAKVKKDIKTAKEKGATILRADLLSPGGSVVVTLEVTRAIREAQRSGLIVEIHGKSLVASGAVLVLAAGSPGHRYILKNSLALIHGVQTGSFWFARCVDYLDNPKTEDEQITNRLIDMVADDLSKSTGYASEDTRTWLTCGLEAVGDGNLLVNFNLADKLE